LRDCSYPLDWLWSPGNTTYNILNILINEGIEKAIEYMTTGYTYYKYLGNEGGHFVSVNEVTNCQINKTTGLCINNFVIDEEYKNKLRRRFERFLNHINSNEKIVFMYTDTANPDMNYKLDDEVYGLDASEYLLKIYDLIYPINNNIKVVYFCWTERERKDTRIQYIPYEYKMHRRFVCDIIMDFIINERKYMSIENYLNSKGLTIAAGHVGLNPHQFQKLIDLTSNKKLNVMEIGFNAGHSAEIFLKNNPELTLTSFDIGEHDYVSAAKEYIDIHYPNRHSLIIGDSRITVPTFAKFHKHIKFDIIFIDGGHDFEIVNADFENCLQLAHKDTIVILDDTMYEFINGPGFVWLYALRDNKVQELGRIGINGQDPFKGVSMTWGKYKM
jgi:hypothetical protein